MPCRSPEAVSSKNDKHPPLPPDISARARKSALYTPDYPKRRLCHHKVADP